MNAAILVEFSAKSDKKCLFGYIVARVKQSRVQQQHAGKKN